MVEPARRARRRCFWQQEGCREPCALRLGQVQSRETARRGKGVIYVAGRYGLLATGEEVRVSRDASQKFLGYS